MPKPETIKELPKTIEKGSGPEAEQKLDQGTTAEPERKSEGADSEKKTDGQ
jgi:hypothetical protein